MWWWTVAGDNDRTRAMSEIDMSRSISSVRIRRREGSLNTFS